MPQPRAKHGKQARSRSHGPAPTDPDTVRVPAGRRDLPELHFEVKNTRADTDAVNGCFFETVMRSLYLQYGHQGRGRAPPPWAFANPTLRQQMELRDFVVNYIEGSEELMNRLAELAPMEDDGSHVDVEGAAAWVQNQLREMRTVGNDVGAFTVIATSMALGRRIVVLQDVTHGAGYHYTTEHGWPRRYGVPSVDGALPLYIHYHTGAVANENGDFTGHFQPVKTPLENAKDDVTRILMADLITNDDQSYRMSVQFHRHNPHERRDRSEMTDDENDAEVFSEDEAEGRDVPMATDAPVPEATNVEPAQPVRRRTGRRTELDQLAQGDFNQRKTAIGLRVLENERFNRANEVYQQDLRNKGILKPNVELGFGTNFGEMDIPPELYRGRKQSESSADWQQRMRRMTGKARPREESPSASAKTIRVTDGDEGNDDPTPSPTVIPAPVVIPPSPTPPAPLPLVVYTPPPQTTPTRAPSPPTPTPVRSPAQALPLARIPYTPPPAPTRTVPTTVPKPPSNPLLGRGALMTWYQRYFGKGVTITEADLRTLFDNAANVMRRLLNTGVDVRYLNTTNILRLAQRLTGHSNGTQAIRTLLDIMNRSTMVSDDRWRQLFENYREQLDPDRLDEALRLADETVTAAEMTGDVVRDLARRTVTGIRDAGLFGWESGLDAYGRVMARGIDGAHTVGDVLGGLVGQAAQEVGTVVGGLAGAAVSATAAARDGFRAARQQWQSPTPQPEEEEELVPGTTPPASPPTPVAIPPPPTPPVEPTPPVVLPSPPTPPAPPTPPVVPPSPPTPKPAPITPWVFPTPTPSPPPVVVTPAPSSDPVGDTVDAEALRRQRARFLDNIQPYAPPADSPARSPLVGEELLQLPNDPETDAAVAAALDEVSLPEIHTPQTPADIQAILQEGRVSKPKAKPKPKGEPMGPNYTGQFAGRVVPRIQGPPRPEGMDDVTYMDLRRSSRLREKTIGGGRIEGKYSWKTGTSDFLREQHLDPLEWYGVSRAPVPTQTAGVRGRPRKVNDMGELSGKGHAVRARNFLKTRYNDDDVVVYTERGQTVPGTKPARAKATTYREFADPNGIDGLAERAEGATNVAKRQGRYNYVVLRGRRFDATFRALYPNGITMKEAKDEERRLQVLQQRLQRRRLILAEDKSIADQNLLFAHDMGDLDDTEEVVAEPPVAPTPKPPAKRAPKQTAKPSASPIASGSNADLDINAFDSPASVPAASPPMGAPVGSPSVPVVQRGVTAPAASYGDVIRGRRLVSPPTAQPSAFVLPSVTEWVAKTVGLSAESVSSGSSTRVEDGPEPPGGEAPVGELPRDTMDPRIPRQQLYQNIRNAFERQGLFNRMHQVRPPVEPRQTDATADPDDGEEWFRVTRKIVPGVTGATPRVRRWIKNNWDIYQSGGFGGSVNDAALAQYVDQVHHLLQNSPKS